MGREILETMSKEYTLGSRSKHDNVVAYHGLGQDDEGDICIVMEYMDGGTFKDLILNPAKFRQIDDSRLFALMDQFTAGLAAIHKVGVIHRDLKPENMIVNFDFSKLKIIDFGIAADTKPPPSKSAIKRHQAEIKLIFSTNAGTQMWQPPELREVRTEGGGYSFYSDYFGCGLIIQFAVRRRMPF